MPAKREQMVRENLWDVCADLEDTYSLIALCSAGILLLSEMTAEQRETAIKRAAKYEGRPLKKPVQDAVTRAKAVRLSTEKPAKSS
jgi:hypothetical protein